MAALIASLAIAGARNSSGQPVSGGRVFLTRPGTQLAVVGYQDADATSAFTLNQGGYVLDAGGRISVYTNEPADIRVEDSTGVTVATYSDPLADAKLVQVRNAGFTGTDPVSGAQVAGGKTYLDTILTNLAASLGGTDGLVKVATTGTGRNVGTKFGEMQVSVKDFGAIGNGVADDTAAIAAAVNYVASVGGGIVYGPPGNYLVSANTNLPAGVSIVGAGGTATIFTNSNTGTGVFTTTAASTYAFRHFAITHTSNSTVTAIDASAGSVALFDGVVVTNHAIGIKSNTGFTVLNGCRLTTSAASTSGALTVAGASTLATVVVGGQYASTVGSGINVSGTNAVLRVFGAYLNVLVGGTAGIDLTATGSSLFAYGANQVGAAVGLRTATDSGTVNYYGCDWGTAGANDRRTGAPVAYTFAGANNMTPLPLQAKVIRVAQGTGGVVTTINNITAIGFEPFVLICSNTSGGASTFTFGANYVLSAAVTPGAGNRVALCLYFDPISGKTFESGRAATAN